MTVRAGGTTTAVRRGVRTLLRRSGALVLAALIALTVASVPTACGGPSEGPKPSGGLPGY